MDNYTNKNKFTDYHLTMANLLANQLIETANEMSLLHLQDGFLQMQFQNEVQDFIDANMAVIRSANTEKSCLECLQNLKQEQEYLTLQDRMLREGMAVIHASVELVRRDDVWVYIVNGVGVVLSGIQVVAGFGVMTSSFAMGNVVGAAFGGMLILHGANGFQESMTNIINGTDNTEGFLKKKYIAVAELAGFDKNVGELVYHSMDVLLSLYGMGRYVLKPEAWRLFYHLNSDYVRAIKQMSRPALSLEVINDTLTIKSLYDKSSSD